MAMKAFVDRPLFLPSRRATPKRPAVVATRVVAPPKPAPPPEPALILLGIVVTPAGREAIVRIDGGRSQSLSEGASVGPWSLTRILADRAIFATPHGAFDLVFQPHKPGAAEPEVTGAAFQAPLPSPPIRRRR
jgi:type II secretory pathway component PulC